MPRRPTYTTAIACATFSLLLCSCGQVKSTFFSAATAHERYADGLRSAGLGSTALARAWTESAQLALADSVVVTLPFAETGYFPAERPRALGYRIRPQRGEHLYVTVTGADPAQVQVFLDVWEQRDGHTDLRAVTSATDSLAVDWVAKKDRTYIVRVQPELLRSARLTISIRNQASIEFPVVGHTSKAIRSFFGVARDGGARKHEGVDVFAPRGTPVLAVANGWATAGNNNLGGKVVWLRSQGRSYYYAHLDSQYVSAMRMVKVGDTLGTVGNTGNARHTPPHLHFGIYASGEGAIDPLPFIHTPTGEPATLKADTTLLSTPVRVAQQRVQLRAAPHAKAPALLELPREHALEVVAAHGDWYRVHHQGRVAYVAASGIQASAAPLRRLQLPTGTAVRDAPSANAPALMVVQADTSAELLAIQGEQHLVRVHEVRGWVVVE